MKLSYHGIMIPNNHTTIIPIHYYTNTLFHHYRLTSLYLCIVIHKHQNALHHSIMLTYHQSVIVITYFAGVMLSKNLSMLMLMHQRNTCGELIQRQRFFGFLFGRRKLGFWGLFLSSFLVVQDVLSYGR